nr:hypothetical protein [Methylobacterium sp. GC_Met_2]
MAHVIPIAAVGAVALLACGSARAASDITIAAIATGRLYVVGTTEQPHMPVVLDGRFRTESDDQGKFQYELVYHPPRCVVSAAIAGKAYDAVVSNCGEQCALPEPSDTGRIRGTTMSRDIGATRSVGDSRQAEGPGPARPADSVAGSEAPVSGDREPTPPGSRIVRPPLPPQRPTSGLGT